MDLEIQILVTKVKGSEKISAMECFYLAHGNTAFEEKKINVLT